MLAGTKQQMEQLQQWYMTEETSSESDGACSLFDSGEWKDLMQAECSNVLEQKIKEKSSAGKTSQKKKSKKKRDVNVVYEAVDEEASSVQGWFTQQAIFIVCILQHYSIIHVLQSN